MGALFAPTVATWEEWGELFQSISAFTPLIDEIYRRRGVPRGEIQNVTPGTNAVFRVGDEIVKIFAPLSPGDEAAEEFAIELYGLRFAQSLGLRTPRLLDSGSIEDRYVFRYFVMERLEGPEAGEALKTLSPAGRAEFVSALKTTLSLLNRAVPAGAPLHPATRAGGGQDWDLFSPPVLRELETLNQTPFCPEPPVYVHGDLTAQNVLLSAEHAPLLIDFADGRIAPPFYEYPPILFDLFDCDPHLIRLFCEGAAPEAVADDAFRGMLLHEFGASFAALLCRRFLLCEPEHLDSIFALRGFLRRYFADCRRA